MGTILCYVLFWVLLTSVINMIMCGTLWNFIKPIKVRLPISKKYNGKLSPIYKVYEEDYTGNYYIQKWELRWDSYDSSVLYLFCFLPFILIRWETYRYHLNDDEYLLCYTEEELMTFTDVSVIYEYKHSEFLKEKMESKIVEDKSKSKINELNKDFNENYIK